MYVMPIYVSVLGMNICVVSKGEEWKGSKKYVLQISEFQSVLP